MENSFTLHPSACLSPYIKHYWILTTAHAKKRTIQTVPSGCTHLVFHRGCKLHFPSKEEQPSNFIRGQFSTHGNLLASGTIDMIAVVFHPLGMTPFFGCPMSELNNRYVDTESLGDSGLNHLKSFVATEPDTLKCIQQIERFLLNRLHRIDYNYKRVHASVQLIINRPSIEVSSLADNACLGYRHFKRVFTESVGMNPKEYIRVIRFQRALYTLQNNPVMDMMQLAFTCGFYDHPHLVKDFKSLSGSAPTVYLSSRSAHSTFFSKDCSLNLVNNN